MMGGPASPCRSPVACRSHTPRRGRHRTTGRWDARSYLHDHNNCPRRRSTAGNRRGHHLCPRSRPPTTRGGGRWGEGEEGDRQTEPRGHRGTTTCADAATERCRAHLTSAAPLPGRSDCHARSGLGPRHRHPCWPYGFCLRSAPTVAWHGGGGGVAVALGLESPLSRPRSDAGSTV
jgi:hypothetical protein